MKPWGQGDWKSIVMAGMVSLGTTVAGWLGGTVWTRYNAEEDMRRSREEDHRLLMELRDVVVALPVQALGEVPARLSTLEAAVEGRESEPPQSPPRRQKRQGP